VTGRHRQEVPRSTARRVLIPALVVVLVAGAAAGWWAYRRSHVHASACRTVGTLTVAAAPEIAPAVSTVAGEWTAKGTSCVRIRVSAEAPADVAAAVAARTDVSVPGLGGPDGTATVPDVWIPDSTTWLERLGAASGSLVLTGRPVAASPVVIAVPQPVATALHASGGTPSWSDLLGKMTSGSIRPGIVDPNVDASGLAALLALSATAGGTGDAKPDPGAQTRLVGAMRALAGGDSQLRADLLGQFPRADDTATVARSLSAAPIPEQALLSFDANRPPVPLVGLYPDPAPPMLDYPYTVLPGLPSDVASAARAFGATLTGPRWRDILAGCDLRAADGTVGAGMARDDGAPPGPLTSAKPSAAAVAQALSTWSAVTVPGRMLAVLDVSGSMTTPVPTAGDKTREQVTVAAAQSGLGLFDDRWTLGLWEFATALDGTKPYKQLVPMGSVATDRASVLSALGGVEPIPGGGTGLYDTVLAAYQSVQKGWDPSRVNSVVIMTDGQNDNPGGLTLDGLLDRLKKIRDPDRPIEVIAIGIGPGVDRSELQKITDSTGGGVFLAPDPSTIGQIFLQAIALRPGTAH
jgi:Ca-activated chloride channel homolog